MPRPHWCLLVLAALLLTGPTTTLTAGDRPNVLWITVEDLGPHLGAYGDRYAITPRLDALAARGLRYTRVWSNAPVCAPARTAILTGMYPASLGAEDMRSFVRPPRTLRTYPEVLRQAGYYCTNNSKEDYNLDLPKGVWDESSPQAHYRGRAAGQPFFAVFNFTASHESQIRRRPHQAVHDPARAPLPPYHPDTPEVRRDWAQYYDQASVVDGQAGELLDELAEAGLAEETIVIFCSDHGSGMPRHKRMACQSGLAVPLIVVIPERFAALRPRDYAPGAASERPIAFVDFAPTWARLAGAAPDPRWQGQAFLGADLPPTPRYQFGGRARMDERLDLVRAVRDEQYVYVRNFLPHRPHGQHVSYMFQTPTTRVWHDLFRAGRLNAAQCAFWQPRAAEELYDLAADPHETVNRASLPEEAQRLARFRAVLSEHLVATRDLGFLPEAELHRRAGERAPQELAANDAEYPLARILAAADAASRPELATGDELAARLGDGDAAVRYWGAVGLTIRGADAVQPHAATLAAALADPAPTVQVAAAEALARYGMPGERERAQATLLDLADPARTGDFVAVLALNALDALGPPSPELAAKLAQLPRQAPGTQGRTSGYVDRLLRHLLGEPFARE